MLISEFEDMWTTDKQHYVLVNVSRRPNSPEYMIVDIRNQGGVIIEDDDVFEEVIQRMLQAGVPVRDELP
jgi:hypothetical protein